MASLKPLLVTRKNSAFQHVETLKRNRTKRNKSGEFLVEGVRCLNAALDNGWTINSVYYAGGRERSQWAHQFVKRARPHEVYELAPELMQELSDKEETSELLATVAIPPDDLERIPVHPNLAVVVLDRPASPGNLGSSIRSCDVFGIDGVIVTGHAADIYHPQAVRGTMGALFARPIVRVPSQKEIFEWLEKVEEEIGRPVRVIGTSAHAERSLQTFDWTGPLAIVMGNETRGLSAGFQAACTDMVSIRQFGYSSSLNVTCALSVILYELRRSSVF